MSYLRAWLTSQANVMTLLGGGLAATIASIPAGGIGAIGALVTVVSATERAESGVRLGVRCRQAHQQASRTKSLRSRTS